MLFPPPAAAAATEPRDRVLSDIPGLMRRLTRLQKLGQEVFIFPDAEEYIQQRLFQLRIEAKIAEIRKDPAHHPLRQELLKVELLPYQMDGVAFAVGAGRAVLADDMGLGKTIQAVGVAELLAWLHRVELDPGGRERTSRKESP